MKKFRKLLMLFIALNSLALALPNNSVNQRKLDKAYENIVENKNVDESYKLINDILDKRNKELKDLNLQSDFLVKREALEWQMFFSAFHGESNRGGHKNKTPLVIQEDSIKTINLGKTITVREVEDINLNPEINIESKLMAEAPNIVIPNINLPNLSISAPGTISSPQVVSPNINVNTNISIPSVQLTPIEVVSFGLPFFDAVNPAMSHNYNIQPSLGYSKNLSAGDTEESILTLFGSTTTRDTIVNNGGTLTVSKQNTRAMEIDEPADRSLYLANRGTINLSQSLTVGMEARGARIINTADLTKHNTFLYNEGTIIGNAKADGTFINQAALSIGLDNSVAGTRVQMINTATGNITMNAPKSIGIQLRPDENLIVQQGYNDGTITINGYRSYGMVTNPGTGGTGFLNQDPANPNGTSGLSLTQNGIINVNGDESTGFAILVPINLWGGDGTINLGTVNPNQDPNNGNLHSSTSLVERSTGLYTNQKEVNVPCGSNPSGSCGSVGINGTGIINVGNYAYQSSGVRVEGEGVAGNAGQINVTGNNNYGAVVLGNGTFHNHIWTPGANGVDRGHINVSSNNSLGIFINENGYATNQSFLTVNGNNSIGILINNGFGQNLGLDNNPLDYWRGDGIIEITGVNSHGVIITKENSGLNSTFINTGIIKNNSENTVGIYGEKGAVFNHNYESGIDPLAQTAKIISGNGAIGVYVKDTGTIANLGAPIITGNSTGSNTSIAVMSDGNAAVIFNNVAGTQSQASINLGNNAVGLYSINGTKFSDTFRINRLKANLGQNSVFAYIKESTANISNLSNVMIDSMGSNSVMLYGANNSDIYIDSDVNVALNTNAQLYVAENSKVTLNAGKTLVTGLTTGLSAFSLDGKLFSDGSQVILDNFKTFVTNRGTVIMNGANSVGMYTLYGQNVNESSGVLDINGNSGVGMYSEEEVSISNKGTINLNNISAVGIYGKGNSGKNYSSADNINIFNSGIINMNSDNNVGITVNNNRLNGMYIDSAVNNIGSININGNDSIGIYAPKSIVNNSGDIILTGNNAIGIYGEQGAEVTSSGTIDLGTNNQLQTAYFITDTTKVKNLGNIVGYGIAVYGKDVTIDDTFDTIDLTYTSDQGVGKVALVLEGNSTLNYTKDIKTGDSAGNNYSVALYTDNQNLLGLSNNLYAGANGVGLYAQNGSNIDYSGVINVGDGTIAGTGLYVGTKAGNGSTVSLDGVINLNGTGGIGAYIESGSTLNFNNMSTMNFFGDGVALYGNSGSIINDNGGLINTNGFNVERIRIKDGTINITADTTITNNNILGHVVDGEMNVLAGITVTALGNEVIGLYADGLKGAGLWTNVYEANNLGTLDFSNAASSTAIYLNNARAENLGLIKVGTDSLGIYGINNSELYNNQDIEIGNKAVGMYGKNSKIENNSNIFTVNDESIGIYGISSNIENKGIIDLNNVNTVGMYGDSSSLINTNTINVNGEKSVGIYGENFSNILNNQDIFMGNSLSINNSNTGIYVGSNSNGANNGNILGGENIIGVYNKGNFDNFGNISLANGSVGIYTDGGISIVHTGSSVHAETALLVKNGTLISNSEDVKGSFIGYAGIKGKLINNADLTIDKTGFYSNFGEIENNGIITAINDEAIFFYSDNAKITNNADVTGSGIGSIGIYGVDSIIDNVGKIVVTDSKINSITNSKLNQYAIGIYGQNSSINNAGNIEIGENAIGIYAGNNSNVVNTGNITAHKNDSVGIVRCHKYWNYNNEW